MKYLIDLQHSTFKGPVPEGEAWADFPETDLVEILRAVDANSWFETGLIPASRSGLVSYRKAAGYEQFVYQIEPGIYPVRWGEVENDYNAQSFMLAHPWRIVIGDFFNGNLLGVRHFYALNPISWWGEQLYAINLPNTNTRGYRGTSIGWVCLYHHDDTSSFTPGQKIDYMLHREAGLSEPYNNANMSSTDGPRFYQSHHAPAYMVSPVQWAAKTKSEGFEWILNEDLLIPLRVALGDHAQSYDPNAPFYTLERAMFEPYSAYYHDTEYDKPFNVLHRQGYVKDQMPFVNRLFNAPVLKQAPKVEVLSPEAILAKPISPIYTDKAKSYTKIGWVCECCENKYSYTDQEPVEVVVAYSQSNATSFYPGIRFDIETCPWCESCTTQETAYITVPLANAMPKALYVWTNLLRWSSYEDAWIFPELGYQCPTCSESYTFFPGQDNRVYSGEDNFVIGCISCMHEDHFVPCIVTNRFVSKNNAVRFTKIDILINQSEPTLSTTNSVPLTSLTNKSYSWVSRLGLEKNKLQVCGCNLLVPSSEPEVCQGCALKPLIDRVCTWEGIPTVAPVYAAAWQAIDSMPSGAEVVSILDKSNA